MDLGKVCISVFTGGACKVFGSMRFESTLMLDGATIKVHQHGSGAKKGAAEHWDAAGADGGVRGFGDRTAALFSHWVQAGREEAERTAGRGGPSACAQHQHMLKGVIALVGIPRSLEQAAGAVIDMGLAVQDSAIHIHLVYHVASVASLRTGCAPCGVTRVITATLASFPSAAPLHSNLVEGGGSSVVAHRNKSTCGC